MAYRAKIKRIVILLLLVCLPIQVISATAIACSHSTGTQSDDNTPTAAACHMGSSHAKFSLDSSPTDCQKCALHLLLVSTPFTQPLDIQLNAGYSAQQPAGLHHYYLLFPPHPERPPLSI